MRVSYFGREGSFSHETALRGFPRARGYFAGLDAHGVLHALYSGKSDCGILPIENSSEGTISGTVDALLSPKFIRSRFRIQEEITLTIHLSLLSRFPLKRIRKVYSHPVPLGHLSAWFKKYLPEAKLIPTHSTSEGAMFASQEPESAAIANQAAAKIYCIPILRDRLLEKPNQTRFYVVARHPFSRTPPQKTAIAFGLPNRPGSLVHLLSIFSNARINLTRITSRPLDKRRQGFRPNEYVFWVDFEGNPATPDARSALRKARKATTFLDIMGAFRSRALS